MPDAHWASRRGRGLLPGGLALAARLRGTREHNLAITLAAQGQFEEALADNEEALRLESEHARRSQLGRRLVVASERRLHARLARVRMALEGPRRETPGILRAGLGRHALERPDDSALCRTGPGRHHSIHPLCAAGEGTRRQCDRRKPAAARSPSRELLRHRSAGPARRAAAAVRCGRPRS